ncbi:MAG: DUF992 domain-containing protein [Methylovirgula sp.]
MGFRLVLAVVCGCAVPLWVGSANVASADQIGILTCNVSPGVGLVITSRQALSCRFSRSYGPPEYYVGTITKFGLALGAVGPGRLVWEVFSATPEPGRFALAGEFTGATAELTLGVGLGANALVGGNAHSIALQPLSVNAQTGVNVAAGVGALALEPARYRYYRHRHHHRYHF